MIKFAIYGVLTAFLFGTPVEPSMPIESLKTPVLPQIEYIQATSTPVDEIPPVPIAESEPILELGGIDYNSPECQCVWWTRQTSKYANFDRVAAAKDIPITSYIPQVGAVGVIEPVGQFAPYGHAFTVLEILSTSTIRITEKNAPGYPCEVNERIVDWTKLPMKGFLWRVSDF